MDACTVVSSSGTGIYSDNDVDLSNCLVYGNGDDIFAGSLYVSASFCDIGDGDFAGSDGNISEDPLFWSSELGDYHLKDGSPCIDAGDPTSPLDEDGSIADMGAFPFDPDYVPEWRTYCSTAPNSVGNGALISALGSQSIGANDFTVTASACPSNQTALFFYGPNRIQLPFGDGYLCVGAGGIELFRLNPPLTTDGAGAVARLVDFSTPPAGSGAGAILPGSEWNFQLWYRDPLGAGGSGHNLSDALTAWFLP